MSRRRGRADPAMTAGIEIVSYSVGFRIWSGGQTTARKQEMTYRTFGIPKQIWLSPRMGI
jgi:hypothetical protein